MAKKKDKRRALRYRIRLNTNIVLQQRPSKKTVVFTTENISARGVFIFSSDKHQSLKIGSTIKVWLYPLEADVSSINFKCKVAHHKVDQNGYGLKIDKIERREKAKLDAFLNFYSILNPDSAYAFG
jgi:c-di-GMP-binding flagellar brake protein YcgR